MNRKVFSLFSMLMIVMLALTAAVRFKNSSALIVRCQPTRRRTNYPGRVIIMPR